MLSPVCIPVGSKFSIVHIVMQLLFLSRITSNSISLKPYKLFSIKIWWTGEIFNPLSVAEVKSRLFFIYELPFPPRVYAGLMTKGKPVDFAAFWASSSDETLQLYAIGTPMSCIRFLNCCLFSDFSIASIFVPKSLTLYFSNTPLVYSS